MKYIFHRFKIPAKPGDSGSSISKYLSLSPINNYFVCPSLLSHGADEAVDYFYKHEKPRVLFNKTIIMKKIIILLSLFAFHFSLTNSQPTQEWVARWPGGSLNGSSEGRSVKMDSQGFIYVLADSGSRGFGFLKYLPSGAFLLRGHNWPAGPYTSGGGTCFDVTPSGDVYISGGLNINLDHWIYTVKFNSGGILQWEKLYNRDNQDTPEDLKVDNQNNIVVVGSAVIGSTGYGLAIKYNSSGDTLWTRYFTNGSSRDMVLDSNNNIYITGLLGPPPSKCLVMRYESNGSLSWFIVFTFNAIYTCVGSGIALDNSGNSYVAGGQALPPDIHNFLLKVNNTGTVEWGRISTLINNGGYRAGPVVSTDGNSIYYLGMSYNDTASGGWRYDATTLKYNSLGDLQWVKYYSGGAVPFTSNFIGSIELDKFDNIYICGAAYYAATGSDFTTVKYTPAGVQQWVATYTGLFSNSDDNANDIFIDTNINVYVTGSSEKINNFDYDAVTIKYNQPIGINLSNNELPVSYKLHQNYPNPFNSMTIITYELSYTSNVDLKIYNSLGQVIKTLVNNGQNPGYYTIILDAENLSSGIYFYQLIANGNMVDSKKLILIK